MCRSPYTSLYHRLVSNIHEPDNEQSCWWWKRKLGKGAYARVNVYVPMLGEVTTLQAHIALWVWLHAEPESIDEFWVQYQGFLASGMELDHLCVAPPCVNPDHLQPVTASENCRLRDQRRKHEHFA
jgi:hypothetical protein